jgi:hypothetical protein
MKLGGTSIKAASYNLLNGGGVPQAPTGGLDFGYVRITTETEGFRTTQQSDGTWKSEPRLLPILGGGPASQDKPGHAESNVVEYFLREALNASGQGAQLTAALARVQQMQDEGQSLVTIQTELRTILSPISTSGTLCLYIDAPITSGGTLHPCHENCGPAIQSLRHWLPNVTFLLAGGNNGKMQKAFPFVPGGALPGDPGFGTGSHSWTGT